MQVKHGQTQGFQQILPLLLSLTASLMLISLMLSPAAAASPTSPNSSQPQESNQIMPDCLCPGGQVGTISGYVINYDNNVGVSGISVYISKVYVPGQGWYTYSTSTDSTGYFSVSSTNIYSGTSYEVTVNCQDPSGSNNGCGQGWDNPAWGEWGGIATTNSNDQASMNINIEPARNKFLEVSALYSNTQYNNELFYGQYSQGTFSHTAGFNAAGNGVTTGYTKSVSVQSGFGVQANYAAAYGSMYYMGSYYCNGGTSSFGSWSCGSPGSITAGAMTSSTGAWGTTGATEYINPNNLPSGSYATVMVSPGSYVGPYTYTESGSFTITANTGSSFDINIYFFSVNVDIQNQLSVTGSTSSSITWKITVPGTCHNTLYFIVYTAGTASYTGTSSTTGGMETHIWYKSGTC